MSLLPAISLGTLIVFGVIWAALHDIARSEADARLEWALLALTVSAVHRAGLAEGRRLPRRCQSVHATSPHPIMERGTG